MRPHDHDKPRLRRGDRGGRAVTDRGEELLTISEVIAELRVPRATFYRWRQLGIGPAAVKLPNGQVRISRAALRQWLGDHATGGDGRPA